MRVDPLFLGPTLPALFFGVPYGVLALGGMGALLSSLFANNFGLMLLLVPYFAAARTISQDQPRIFDFMLLWLDTKLQPWVVMKLLRRKAMLWAPVNPRRY